MLQVKNLDIPDEKRTLELGEIVTVHLGAVTMSRTVFQPGWRWSTHVGPVVGRATCPGLHQAVVVGGQIHVLTDAGEERVLGAGDAHVVGPGHDAWVEGDEPCVTIDFEMASEGSVECVCGVVFTARTTEAIEHVVSAVREHARSAHGHDLSEAEVRAQIA